MQPDFNTIGVLMVIVFFASLMTVFGWMFALKPQQSNLNRVRKNTTGHRSILVRVTDSVDSERAVELACRLALGEQAQVILAYVIEVPLTLPLNASLAELEAKARDALNAATLIVEPRRLPCVTRIVRDRATASGLIQLARDAGACMVVVGFRGSLQSGLGDLVTVSTLFRKAPCEVVIAWEPVPFQKNLLRSGRMIEPSMRS